MWLNLKMLCVLSTCVKRLEKQITAPHIASCQVTKTMEGKRIWFVARRHGRKRQGPLNVWSGKDLENRSV
jgi:hypothetical protein